MPNNGGWALWTVTQISNRKWTLLGDRGEYLNFCHNCLEDSHFEDYAFV